MNEYYLRVDACGRELQNHGTLAFPCACYHSTPGEENVPWHWHDEIEIMYVIKGSLSCAVGNRRFLLHSEEAIFINSGIPHAFYLEGGKPYEESDIVFHPRLIYGDVGSVYYEKYMLPLTRCVSLSGYILHPNIPWQSQAIRALCDALTSCAREPELYECTVRSALTAVCALLWQNNQEEMVQPVQHTNTITNRVKRMLDYFHQHYQETITLEQLASQVNICRRECQRNFKTVLGLTPTQYFEQYRLSMAVKYLLESGDSIIEIAGKCGFQSPSYFTRLFREQYGNTPTDFRKIHRLPKEI